VETESVQVFIGMGSNLGDSRTTLLEAWQAIGEADGVECRELSSPYLTAPVDMSSQHWFTNAVGRLGVTLPPLRLLECLMEVEASFGRNRKKGNFGYRDRTLDLDILYYGDLVLDVPELIIPHPRIADRLFVLVPLVELDPGFIDTVSGRTAEKMKNSLMDQMEKSGRAKQEIIKSSWK
jgi:2-amino-4-hydroxy-6-hydroxymethyldihydropteridine diphosphokinase